MAVPTSSVGGLVSGLDTANIIKQLMSIERRPVKVMNQRIDEEKVKLEAYRGVNSLLQKFSQAATKLDDSSLYKTKNATSSNEASLSVAAGELAATGTQTFSVGRLAQTSQFMTTGFADFNTTPIAASGGGTVRIDSAKGGVVSSTELSQLNGGRGIFHGSIKITDKSGSSAVFDLSTSISLQEVLDKINQSSAVAVTAAVDSGGDNLIVTDTSGGTGSLTIGDVGLGTTATDLGLTTGTISGNSFVGSVINRIGSGTALASLRDGLGINNGSAGVIILDDGLGNNFNVDLSNAITVQNVIDTINTAAAGAGSTLTAAIKTSGKGLTISGTGAENITVLDSTTLDSANTTSRDLGIFKPVGAGAGVPVVGDNLIAALNSVRIASLSGQDFTANDGINGARLNPSLDLGSLTITGTGGPFNVDLTMLNGQSSLSDLVNQFNTQATGFGTTLKMQINKVGNGVEIVNSSAANTYGIADNVGTTATDLGLNGASIGSSATVNGGDIDRQYLSRATKLSSLNNGNGVSPGRFRLTNSNGLTFEVDTSSMKTLGDLTAMINGSGQNVLASINATGDGVLLTDSAGGAQNLSVTELNGGRVAGDLGLLGVGTGAPGASILDGSFERVVNIDTNDTLQDAMTKIYDSGARVQTSIINDGSTFTPFRMVIASKDSGNAGDMIIDTTLPVFNFQKTAKGQDSVLLLGAGSGGVSPTLLTSSTNTNNTAVLGLTLNLKNVSAAPVTITVSQDTKAISTAFSDVIDANNALQSLVKKLDTFDTKTGTPGLLFGDTATRNLLASISDVFFNTVQGNSSGFTSLFDVGLSFKQDGSLALNSSRFSELLRTDFEGVHDLLTQSTDVANKGLNAFATINDAPAAGTKLENLINGNKNSNDFGATNGFESTGVIGSAGMSLVIDLPKPQYLSKVVLNQINSTAMPADKFSLRDFSVEYLNPNTNQFELLRNIVGNTAAQTYASFRVPTLVSQLRIKATSTNAADGKFRLVEVEAFSSDGQASQLNRVLNKRTDSVDGYFAQKQDLVQGKIDDLNTNIASQEERLAKVEEGLNRQFASMEGSLSLLNTQSSFFQQQMGAISGSNKK